VRSRGGARPPPCEIERRRATPPCEIERRRATPPCEIERRRPKLRDAKERKIRKAVSTTIR